MQYVTHELLVNMLYLRRVTVQSPCSFFSRVTSEVEVASSSLLFISNELTDFALFLYVVLSWLVAIKYYL